MLSIVVETYSVEQGYRLMGDMIEVHKDKIKNIKRYERKIMLINGDVIRLITPNTRNDGIRADVAIGPNADHLTCRSKQEKRVWDIEGLYNHIKNIKQ